MLIPTFHKMVKVALHVANLKNSKVADASPNVPIQQLTMHKQVNANVLNNKLWMHKVIVCPM